MSLVACRECGKEVSEAAGTCPHCGVVTPSPARFAHNERNNRSVIIGCLLIPLIFVGWCAIEGLDDGREPVARESACGANGYRRPNLSDMDGGTILYSGPDVPLYTIDRFTAGGNVVVTGYATGERRELKASALRAYVYIRC